MVRAIRRRHICGISGIIHDTKGKTRFKYDDFINDYAIIGMVRGECSTGIFQTDNKGRQYHHKSRASGFNFRRERDAKSLIDDTPNSPITVLHHRAATVGSISDENAHPFEHYYDAKGKQERYVLGCHNGRFTNFRAEEDGLKFTVDSDWGLYQIWKHGAAKGVGSLTGDMAIVWVEEDAKLRFYCNGNREFHFAFVKDENAIVFGSESAMLHMIATRNGILLEDPIMSPDSDIILVLDPKKPREFEKVQVEKKQYTPPVSRIPHSLPWTSEGSPNRNLTNSNATGGASANNRGTFQNQLMDFSNPKIKEALKCDYQQQVEFFPDFKEWKHLLGTSSCVVGDCIYETETDGKKTTHTQYAMMLAPNAQAVANMHKASKNGTIKATIIGVTNLIVPTEPKDACKFRCAILSNPTHTEFGDDEIATAEIVINNEVTSTRLLNNETARQAEIALANYDSDKALEELDKLFGNDITHIPGPGGLLLPIADFAGLIKNGCGCCQCDLTPAMARKGDIAWRINSIGSEDPLCISCAERIEEQGTVH